MNRYIAPYFATRTCRVTAIVIVANFAFFAALLAISSWFVFLFLEIVEWVRLIWLERLGFDTPFGGTFLMLAGTHWIAATGCVGWFAWGAVDVAKRDLFAAALYSHFLNFWWIILWITLYLSNGDLAGF